LFLSPVKFLSTNIFPDSRSEQLLITVDTHTGIFLAHVPQHEDNPFTRDIQQRLNDAESRCAAAGGVSGGAAVPKKVEALVSQLRFWITKQRVHKTLQQLPATSYARLPILFDPKTHPLKDLSENRMQIRLHRHPNAILIIEFHEKAANHCEMEYKFYFLWVRPASIDDTDEANNASAMATESSPRVYLKALSMVEFDPFLVTHGSSTKVDAMDLSERIIGKRKPGGKVEAPIKRTKFPAYFISDLAHVVSFADERIPFTALAMELSKKGVSHSGVEIEDCAAAVGLVVKIVNFPSSMSKSR
jgi:mediator of RNA polymerase II transcription subunit 14